MQVLDDGYLRDGEDGPDPREGIKRGGPVTERSVQGAVKSALGSIRT